MGDDATSPLDEGTIDGCRSAQPVLTPHDRFRQVFRSGRSLYAAQAASARIETGPILDYGCGTGDFAAHLSSLITAPIHACDMSLGLVSTAAKASAVHYFTISEPERPTLPFVSAYFRTIFLLDVLEHIGARTVPIVLAELRRVLHRDGQLIITVPHRGLFGWADPENFKFGSRVSTVAAMPSSVAGSAMTPGMGTLTALAISRWMPPGTATSHWRRFSGSSLHMASQSAVISTLVCCLRCLPRSCGLQTAICYGPDGRCRS